MSEYRYVWDLVRTQIVDAGGNEWVACPHRRWGAYDAPPYCHECMEPGLLRLVREGAHDDEVLPAFAQIPVPERRWIEATLRRLRRAAVPSPDGLTALQRDKLPRVPAAKTEARRKYRRLSVSGLAAVLELDRGTLQKWIDEGLVTLD